MGESFRATEYLQLRRGYPPELYEKILSLTGVPVSLLDISTGTGTVIKDMKPYLSQALGIDGDPEKIKIAKFLTTANVRFDCLPIEKFSPEKEYDLITIGQTFHHLSLSSLRVLHRSLRPGGTIAVFWKYPDPDSRMTEILNKVLTAHGLPERRDMGKKLAQLNPSGILTEWRFLDPELSIFKSQELFSHEDGIKSILWGLDLDLDSALRDDLQKLLPGSMTEVYDCYLWTARK